MRATEPLHVNAAEGLKNQKTRKGAWRGEKRANGVYTTASGGSRAEVGPVVRHVTRVSPRSGSAADWNGTTPGVRSLEAGAVPGKHKTQCTPWCIARPAVPPAEAEGEGSEAVHISPGTAAETMAGAKTAIAIDATNHSNAQRAAARERRRVCSKDMPKIMAPCLSLRLRPRWPLKE